MAKSGFVIFFIVIAVTVEESMYKWQDINNSCTELASDITIGQIENKTAFSWWWSFPSTSSCISAQVLDNSDGTYSAVLRSDKNFAFHIFYDQTLILVPSPTKASVAEIYVKSLTIMTTGILNVIVLNDAGYGIASCSSVHGKTDIYGAIVGFPDATPAQMETLKDEFQKQLPSVPLNKVGQCTNID